VTTSTHTAPGSGRSKPTGSTLVTPGPSLETPQPSAAAQNRPSAASSRALMFTCTSCTAIPGPYACRVLRNQPLKFAGPALPARPAAPGPAGRPYRGLSAG